MEVGGDVRRGAVLGGRRAVVARLEKALYGAVAGVAGGQRQLAGGVEPLGAVTLTEAKIAPGPRAAGGAR